MRRSTYSAGPEFASNFQEIVEALLPFLQALDRLGILYYLGGSVASS